MWSRLKWLLWHNFQICYGASSKTRLILKWAEIGKIKFPLKAYHVTLRLKACFCGNEEYTSQNMKKLNFLPERLNARVGQMSKLIYKNQYKSIFQTFSDSRKRRNFCWWYNGWFQFIWFDFSFIEWASWFFTQWTRVLLVCYCSSTLTAKMSSYYT